MAADCFKDVLRECGVPEDKADLARRAFCALRYSSQEDVRDRLMRIASQLSNDPVQLENSGSDNPFDS